MTRGPVRWLGAAMLAALVTAACGGPARPAAPPAPAPAPRPESSGAAAEEFEALFRARMDSARTRFTEADVRFMTHMIGHHAQAVVAANLAESHAASPSVRILAGRIISAQQDEIATMQTWLRDRGQPVPEVHVMDGQLMVHGAEHAMHMPGMLTAEQMRQLERARGAEFDRLFLTYMVQHHRGAVEMVRELFNTDGAGQDEAVFKFASDVQVDQTTEINRMEQMLSAMAPAGRRP